MADSTFVLVKKNSKYLKNDHSGVGVIGHYAYVTYVVWCLCQLQQRGRGGVNKKKYGIYTNASKVAACGNSLDENNVNDKLNVNFY